MQKKKIQERIDKRDWCVFPADTNFYVIIERKSYIEADPFEKIEANTDVQSVHTMQI